MNGPPLPPRQQRPSKKQTERPPTPPRRNPANINRGALQSYPESARLVQQERADLSAHEPSASRASRVNYSTVRDRNVIESTHIVTSTPLRPLPPVSVRSSPSLDAFQEVETFCLSNNEAHRTVSENVLLQPDQKYHDETQSIQDRTTYHPVESFLTSDNARSKMEPVSQQFNSFFIPPPPPGTMEDGERAAEDRQNMMDEGHSDSSESTVSFCWKEGEDSCQENTSPSRSRYSPMSYEAGRPLCKADMNRTSIYDNVTSCFSDRHADNKCLYSSEVSPEKVYYGENHLENNNEAYKRSFNGVAGYKQSGPYKAHSDDYLAPPVNYTLEHHRQTSPINGSRRPQRNNNMDSQDATKYSRGRFGSRAVCDALGDSYYESINLKGEPPYDLQSIPRVFCNSDNEVESYKVNEVSKSGSRRNGNTDNRSENHLVTSSAELLRPPSRRKVIPRIEHYREVAYQVEVEPPEPEHPSCRANNERDQLKVAGFFPNKPPSGNSRRSSTSSCKSPIPEDKAGRYGSYDGYQPSSPGINNHLKSRGGRRSLGTVGDKIAVSPQFRSRLGSDAERMSGGGTPSSSRGPTPPPPGHADLSRFEEWNHVVYRPQCYTPTRCTNRTNRNSLPPPGDCCYWHSYYSYCHHGSSPYWCRSERNPCCSGRCTPVIYGPSSQNEEIEELHERVHRLEMEKENLMMQVSVLTDQVEAQTDKLRELEADIEEKKEQIDNTEEMLQQELLTRSSLESSKFDLITEVSNLRLRLSTVEQEKQDCDEAFKKAENQLIMVQARLAEKDAEMVSLQSRLSCNGTVTPSIDCDSELDKLKKALQSVITANDEKEKKIEELKSSLSRYRLLHDVATTQGKKDDLAHQDGKQLDKMSSHDLSLSPSSLAESGKTLQLEPRVTDKPPPVPRSATSPGGPDPHSSPLAWRDGRLGSSPSPVYCQITPPSAEKSSPTVPRSNSAENVSPTQQRQTPPSKRHYGTIPRQHGAQVLQQIHQQLRLHQVDASTPSEPQPSSPETTKTSPATVTSTTTPSSVSPSIDPSSTPQSFQHPSLDNFRSPRTKSSGVSFGKGFFKLKNGKRSSSAPELALPEYAVHPNGRETPRSTLSRSRESPQSMLSLPQGSPNTSSKSEPKERKGIKKIFGKLKRSGSQSMDLVGGDFSRNRLRATAGPRLGWSEGTGPEKIAPDIPFAQWDTDMVANWLHRIGLNMYVNECKRWVKNGDHLLKASQHDLEKELGIKNPFHRKKLQLAFQSLGSKSGDLTEAAGKLDYQWVTRWLDDIGLPQYKDTFLEARIDGRMLHHLTVEDLFNLKVFNQLHHISVKRGIQVLRENSFEPFCLKRRSLPDESKAYDSREVALWTNHRVMEWLRTVDLSEYAPNLRGSGVHGSLMVYEPRFTAELLATLLNIPPNKTLLRRHLITHFRQVVGLELMQKKREAEGQAGYVPLTPSAKVKAVRRGHFTLKKKRKNNEVVFEDYVCPMDIPEKPPKSLDNESGHRNGDSTSQQEHKY
ncbi:liprin-beta-1-like isoform X3 [Limulus polyphemus]|uniref:Liprin-beta-1-like isoform X3 n=1 Tax=Limulus polyphemus TaxID=6850 RepID=A0ABM1T9Z3_LIMPO|nr:liprin-beta-1-like isoform X3 [Limulus polyphemus]